MEWIAQPEAWVALATLTILEIVLGIDNIVFISILTGRLPKERQGSARIIGLGLAMVSRLLLLLAISWIIGLTRPLFEVFDFEISARDLILLGGGIFLIYKATVEIHHRLEGESDEEVAKVATPSYASVLFQIALLDIVFSLDSVITAVAMADHIGVMVTAIVIAVGIMLVAVNPVSEFVEKHPTVKMLALSFLLLIGFTLIADAFGQHIPKGYIYFAMGFSIFVEVLNLRARAVRKSEREPVELRRPYPIKPAEERRP